MNFSGHLYLDFSEPFPDPSMFGLFRPLHVGGDGDLFNQELEGGPGPLVSAVRAPLLRILLNPLHIRESHVRS